MDLAPLSISVASTLMLRGLELRAVCLKKVRPSVVPITRETFLSHSFDFSAHYLVVDDDGAFCSQPIYVGWRWQTGSYVQNKVVEVVSIGCLTRWS